MDAGRRGPGRAGLALPVVAALLALGVVPAAARSAAGAGAHVRSAAADTAVVENRAYLTYRAADGVERTAAAAAAVTVQRPAVEVVPSYEATLEPGGRRAFAHRVRNGGAAADRFRLEASAPAGWRVSVFLDVDGDGELGERDAALSGPVALEGGASAALLMLVEVPLDRGGGEAEAVLRATSETDAAVTAAATDRIVVARGRTAATLEKTADRADAFRGDTVAYTIAYANRGVATFPDARLGDPLPRGLRFVPGSLRWNGAALTDAADADAGSVERDPTGRWTVAVRLGALAPGAAGTVAFRATVEADAAEGPVANVATLTLGDNQVASTPAETRVGEGRLEVGKERLGSGPVRAGGEVAYRLTWANRSASPVRDALLVDTLPAELSLLHAEGSPETEGRVVRWRLGTLQPGAAGSFSLSARVSPAAVAGVRLVNRAVASGGGVAAAVAEAAPVTVVPAEARGLELRKTAGSLEAGVGETVVYTLAVRNPGDAPLDGVVVRDLLPEGTRLVEGSVWGADSARVAGRELRLAVPALAPGAERTLRYALALVAPGREGSVGNRAWAEAAGGARSDTAVAWVRLRRGFALQGRTLVGKVWLDEDGDGRQGPGEEGVPGASVWSADGEVVTTDREGRFSFRDLRAGTHVLRLDTLGLPAGYTTARPGEELLTVRMDGWTAPRAAFRLVRRLAGTGDAAAGA
ncbi:MAG TPA: SdrD B-like domain-containing protein, partial [Longimicrobiaceae bacterium]|nr:SdrD B-like domain-containing protein [Longimicrobiaceae bacterium]